MFEAITSLGAGGGREGYVSNWVFCSKFNFRQLMFEAFFDAIGTFGCVQPKSEFTFPF